MRITARHVLALGAAVLFGRALLQRTERYSFTGRTVVVTGGSRGLGLILARQLAGEGARIAICARDDAELERAAADIAARGAMVLPVRCDVRERARVEQMMDKVREAFGPIDALFNVAGVIQFGPLESMTEADYRDALAVHYWGPLYAIEAVLPDMRQNTHGEGRIVNITSIGGVLPIPHMVPYSASKYALVGLSQSLHAALARNGIRVTTVVPGLMRTGSAVHGRFKGRHRQEYAWFSVAASAPLLSMDAERAAARILEAARRGEAQVVLGAPARAARLSHALAPGLTLGALAMAHYLLPRPGGIGTSQARGAVSRPSWLPTWSTALGDRAARRHNERVH